MGSFPNKGRGSTDQHPRREPAACLAAALPPTPTLTAHISGDGNFTANLHNNKCTHLDTDRQLFCLFLYPTNWALVLRHIKSIFNTDRPYSSTQHVAANMDKSNES